jgi:ribosomal protein S18 acetylase RimI-like enzyme
MTSDEDSGSKTKKPNIKIRQMEIDDVASVFHLGEKLYQAEKTPNLYRTWDEYEVIDFYQSDPEFCLVAESENGLVGFALGTTITKSHSAWKYGHLVWLSVDPACQRLGVAEKLFHRFKDLMLEDGVRMLIVDTEAENLPALFFFRKMGFGNPQEHIYLSLNLATEIQLMKKRSGRNGGSPERRQRKEHG